MKTAARQPKTVLLFISTPFETNPIVVDLDGFYKMKPALSMAELLALVEIVDEHVDRNFPGVDPPRLLREVQQKLDAIIGQHRKEIDTSVKSGRKTKFVRG